MRSFSALLVLIVVAGSLMVPVGCGEEDSTVTSGAGGTSTTVEPVPTQTAIPFTNPEPAAIQATEEAPPYGAGLTGSQSVGTLIDGLQLRDIRWSDHGTYFRIVFEMGTSDGQLILQPPHADSSMSPDQKQITVILGGIRSLGSNETVTAQGLDIGDSLVVRMDRLRAEDDQSLVYTIDLSQASTYSLAGLGSPGRIIIDVNKP